MKNHNKCSFCIAHIVCDDNAFDNDSEACKIFHRLLEEKLKSTNRQRITFCGCTENDIKETLVNDHRITVCKCGNMGINPPQNVSHL